MIKVSFYFDFRSDPREGRVLDCGVLAGKQVWGVLPAGVLATLKGVISCRWKARQMKSLNRLDLTKKRHKKSILGFFFRRRRNASGKEAEGENRGGRGCHVLHT